NAFTFEKDNIRVHRSWNIGVGKLIPNSDLIPKDAHLIVEKAGGALSEDNFWSRVGDPRVKEYHPVDGEEEEEEEEEEVDVCEKDQNSKKCKKEKALISALYRCPVESCSKEFISEKNLEHLDDAYLAVLNNNANGVRQPMGWALTKRRTSRRFPKSVKDFLFKIYDEGAKTGVKVDPRGAEERIAGVFTGFKKTSITARKKADAKKNKKKMLNKEDEEMEVEEEVVDEVNDLFNTEGDEELEYETEPLFDQEENMRRAVMDQYDDLFTDDEEE
ncbi:hypothetical protein PENTCL1PPCAC_8441, partial [Pristionchus entomophagus]